jgi:threonine synthase
MKYISTRGNAPELNFEDVIITGLAADGGLYVPETWPQLSPDQIRSFASMPYCDVAYEVMVPFVDGTIGDNVFKDIIAAAYAGFSHPAVVPLKEMRPNEWILEIFHGPTFAFKDVALQVLGRLIDHVLEKRDERATIVVATSGDTGGAAIEGFRGSNRTDVFVLHPHERVSEVQRRQMTTVPGGNVHNIALEGTFDDCQGLVKAMFNHSAFRDNLKLSGVNSINWARIMAQIVYYFTSASSLGAPDRLVRFCVPTGNFGDIYAGYAAGKMGLPIDKLTIATNMNDILERVVRTGRYEALGVTPTVSPSMDIQVSSNFERLLFDAHGRDSESIVRLMSSLNQSGAFTLSPEALKNINDDFDAVRTEEEETLKTIADVYTASGVMIDPHTAVALAGSRCCGNQNDNVANIVLSTAHPAKFPDAVEKATGHKPHMPPELSALFDLGERFSVLPNDLETVEGFIEAKARANRGN